MSVDLDPEPWKYRNGLSRIPDPGPNMGDGWNEMFVFAPRPGYEQNLAAYTDPEPRPGDGPDFHAEHAAWSARNHLDGSP